MDEKEEGLPTTGDGVDESLNELYGNLLDVNQEIITSSRDKARGILELRDLYLDQSSRCEEIAALHIRGAQIISNTLGDILANEFGVVETEEEEEDGEEEDES